MLVFDTLRLHDADTVQKFVNQFEPYSDFNFLSLYSWSLHSQTKFSLADDCLFLLIPDYVTHKPIATYLCHERFWENLNRFKNWLEANRLEQNFDLLPSIVAQNLRPALENSGISYSLEENIGAHDYILDVGKVSAASGKEYDDFRSKRNRFRSAWGQEIIEVKFNPNSRHDQLRAANLANKWAERKKLRNEVYEDEIDAFNRFLSAAKNNERLRFSALEREGQLMALASCEVLTGSYAIGHFLKYDWEYKGVYYDLVHKMCHKLKSENITWLNIEQDLDISGLREAKRRLRPVGYLKKYSLKILREG